MTESEHDALAWLAGTDTDEPERPSTSVSGHEAEEPGAWVSPLRRMLQGRAERNRHPDGCDCVRCAGVAPGNTLALDHGSYSLVEIQADVRAVMEQLAPLLPDPAAGDVVALELLATATVRTRRAMTALEAAHEAGELDTTLRLSQDARGWLTRCERIAERLGLTPSSRAQLGLTRAETARAELAALADAADVSKWSDEELRAVRGLLEKATQEPGR